MSEQGQGTIPYERIREARERASDAFWQSITESFPEVATGDMDPAEAGRQDDAMDNAIRAWLFWNHTDGGLETARFDEGQQDVRLAEDRA